MPTKVLTRRFCLRALKKSSILPALLVDCGNGGGSEIQVIRQKNEAARERILDFDQAKETDFVLGGQSVKENHLVTDDSTVFGKRGGL